MRRRVRPQMSTLAAAVVLAICAMFVVPVASASAPSATIVVADTALAIGETSLVTFTFSEAVLGFTNADLTIANGTLSAVSSGDGGITWTATLTPTASVSDAANVITLDNTGVTDSGSVAGSGTTNSNNYAIDTMRPTATIVVADTALAAGETSQVTVTFSEAVTGFSTADLTAANGVVSGLSSSDGGVTWTATLTPTSGIADVSNLISLDNTGVADAAGNTGSGTTDSNNYAIDTMRPTATIAVAGTFLTAVDTATATFTFSEAVTGFSNADLTIENGTLSAVSSADGGITWTATLTPTAGVDDATNLITLTNAGVVDAAGNAGSGSTDSNNYSIHTVRPTAAIVVADTSLSVGETSPVTITFSEAVRPFSDAALATENGTLSPVSSSDGGVTWTATLTPTAGVNDSTNVITLDNTRVETSAAARNPGLGTTDSNNYTVNTVPVFVPATATIALADVALSVDETSLVTFTFSRAVWGLDNGDLTVANGTLTPVASADGGTTWTATFTPTAGIEDATNVITLDNSGVAEAGFGTTDSPNYEVDTLRPTASITVADTDLGSGESTAVTITFSEAVAGLTNADLSVANATLSAVSSSDGGVTWTATLTPAAGIADGSNVITLDNTGIVDLAGNTGSGTTVSTPYAVDTVAPSSRAAGPSVTGTRTFTIGYVAKDDGGGVASVDLYVRTPGSATYTLVASDSTPLDGAFTYTGARNGSYRFYTVATDAAGNVEAAPDSPDHRTRLDTHDPVLWAAMGSDPVAFSHSTDRRIGLRFRVNEHVSYQITIRRHGRAVRTFDVQTSQHGRLQHGWRGRNDEGHRVRPRRYRVVVTATDAAGNRSRTGERLHVRR